MRKWAFTRQGYKLNPSFSTVSIEDCPPFRTCFVDGFCGTTVVSKFPLGMGVVAQKDKSLAGPTVVHDTGILMLSRAR